MKLLRALAAVLAVVLTAMLASAPAFAGERTPKPTVSIENPGKCVAPAEEMRRNHMEMLKHQRDRTLRAGIRGEPASLNACIDCHASKKTGSVLGEGGFCQGCHSYAAVTLDCFECHQPKAKFKAGAQAAAETGRKP